MFRTDGNKAGVGCGLDITIVGLVAVRRVKFVGEIRDAVACLYPNAEEARTPAPSWMPPPRCAT